MATWPMSRNPKEVHDRPHHSRCPGTPAPPWVDQANSDTGGLNRVSPRGFCRSEVCNLLPSESAKYSLCKMDLTLPKVKRMGTLADVGSCHGGALRCCQPGVTNTGSSLGVLPRTAPQRPTAIRVTVCEKLPRAETQLSGFAGGVQPSVQPFLNRRPVRP